MKTMAGVSTVEKVNLNDPAGTRDHPCQADGVIERVIISQQDLDFIRRAGRNRGLLTLQTQINNQHFLSFHFSFSFHFAEIPSVSFL
jgi:hypothetical protein